MNYAAAGMSEDEVKALLAMINSVDPRQRVDRPAIEMWHVLLGRDLPFAVASRAAGEYLRENTRLIMPADVMSIGKRIQRKAWEDGERMIEQAATANVTRSPCEGAATQAAREATNACLQAGYSRSDKVTRDSAFAAASAVIEECTANHRHGQEQA